MRARRSVVAFLSLTATVSLQAAAAAVLLVAVLVADASAQATAVSVSGTTYSQNFDGITTGSTSSRKAARLHETLSALQDLLQRTCVEGRDPGRGKSQLVV